MARLWLRNFAPDLGDQDLSALLHKYGFPHPDTIDVFDDGQERHSALVRFTRLTTSELAELASRVRYVFWHGCTLDAQVAIPVG
jgi:hypothetical protein